MNAKSCADAFARALPGLPGGERSELASLRRAALERFKKAGFPTTQDEDWRFTDLSPALAKPFEPTLDWAKVPAIGERPRFGARLVFVNGRFAPELSDKPAAHVRPLSEVLRETPKPVDPRMADGEGALASLNTAFFSDGALVRLTGETPAVHLLFLTGGAAGTPPMIHTRVLVLTERGSRGLVVEEHAGLGGTYFSNHVAEVFAAEGASVEHVRIQNEGLEAFHVSSTRARLAKDARYAAHAFGLGAALSRSDVLCRLEAEGADCSLNGLYLASGTQHADHHTRVIHERPHGSSRELYKGILDGKARAVFDGAIEVTPDAQKTDAKVYNKNLLLSETALINTKPEFKIHANDVQCKHGATVGQLSSDALFYLRSRGIGAVEARNLLVHAFAGEMLAALPEMLREPLNAAIDARLP